MVNASTVPRPKRDHVVWVSVTQADWELLVTAAGKFDAKSHDRHNRGVAGFLRRAALEKAQKLLEKPD